MFEEVHRTGADGGPGPSTVYREGLDGAGHAVRTDAGRVQVVLMNGNSMRESVAELGF